MAILISVVGFNFLICLCKPASSKYILLGVYSFPSPLRVSDTNLQSYSHNSVILAVVNTLELHCSSGYLWFLAIRHASKFLTAHSVFFSVLCRQLPSLYLLRLSASISNENLSVFSFCFFSFSYTGLPCARFNESDFRLSSILIQQGHHSGIPKQKEW